MKRFPSIKKNTEFRDIYDTGKPRANKYLVMYVKKNGLDHSRIGISVSKKIGNSVVRHRMTRLLREVFRLHTDEIRKGNDFVVVLRPDFHIGKQKRHFFICCSCMVCEPVPDRSVYG